MNKHQRIKCPSCTHEWTYTGRNFGYYITCPKCYNKVNTKKQEAKNVI